MTFVTDITPLACESKSPVVRVEVGAMAFASVEEIPVDKKRAARKSSKFSPMPDEPEALESAELIHPESCRDDDCDVRIVTRYFLKSA